MTSRTSLIISGSSAEVGSSKSITLGSIARDLAMATRCCCPPESWAGYLCACSSTPTRSRSSMARFSAAALGVLAHLDRAERDVLEDRLVREEVEGLEDHADVSPQLGELLALLGQRLPVDGDRPGLHGLEPVDRATEGGLARSRRPDDDDDLTLADGEVDVLEHVEVAEVLVDAREDDKGLRHAENLARHVRAGRRGTAEIPPRPNRDLRPRWGTQPVGERLRPPRPCAAAPRRSRPCARRR